MKLDLITPYSLGGETESVSDANAAFAKALALNIAPR